MGFVNDWVLLGLMCMFLYLYNYFRNKSSFVKLPPGPPGFPLLGILPFLGKYPERQFSKWSKKYGSIISVKIGLKNYVVLNDYDAIYQVSLALCTSICYKTLC